MKKTIKVILVILVLLVVGAVLATMVFLNQLVQKGVETGGPKLLGVATTVEDVDLKPLRGEFLLQQLTVGSPEGFKSDHILQLGSLAVYLDVGTVTDDTIFIRNVRVDSLDVTYELGLTGSNLGQLLKNLERNIGGASEDKPADEPFAQTQDDATGKKVVIENLVIENGTIHVAAKMLKGPRINIPLPTIHLKDIGKESDGASLPVVVGRVLKAIITTVLQTVSKSGALVGQGLKAGAGVAVQGAGLAIDAGGKAAAVVGNAAGQTGALLGQGASTVGQGAGAAASAVGQGAGAAASAVGQGAGAAVDLAGRAGAAVGGGAAKVVGGLTGLFTKDTEATTTNESEEANEEDVEATSTP